MLQLLVETEAYKEEASVQVSIVALPSLIDSSVSSASFIFPLSILNLLKPHLLPEPSCSLHPHYYLIIVFQRILVNGVLYLVLIAMSTRVDHMIFFFFSHSESNSGKVWAILLLFSHGCTIF